MSPSHHLLAVLTGMPEEISELYETGFRYSNSDEKW